jgi:DNA-binding beta-propeller fold protein YncE
MTPLLLYSITTNPFPLQASPPSGNTNVAQLTIVATNNSGSDITLQGIMVQIPVGQNAPQLTDDSTDIGPVPPANWNPPQVQTPTGFVQYSFLPQSGCGTLPSGQSLNFIFNNIQVNSSTGPVEIDLTEGSNNCIPGVNCPVQQLFITKFPNGWGQVSFWVDPPNIPFGSNTSLNWDGPSGATYTIQYYDSQRCVIVNIPAQGQPVLSNKGKYPSLDDPPLTLEQTTVFTLNVSDNIEGQQYQAQDQATVTVEEPIPVVTQFTGFFQKGDTGTELILNWNTDHADSCMISGDPNLLRTASTDNSYKIFPSVQTPLLTRYTLTAKNAAGQSTSTLTVIWGSGNSMPVAYPVGVAVSPDATKAYAVNQDDGTGNSLLLEVSSVSLQLIGTTSGIGYTPQPVVVSSDGSRIYIGNDDLQIGSGPPFVRALDGTVSPPVALGQAVQAAGRPLFLAVTPDGTRLFVLNFGGNSMSVFTASSDRSSPLSFLNTITVCDPGTYQAVSGLAISPDGKRVYVGTAVRNDYNSPWVSKIVVVDPVSLAVIGGTLVNEGSPSMVAVTPDGSHVLVGVSTLNEDDALVIFTLAADPKNPLNHVGAYTVSGYIMGVGGSPDNSCAYAVSERRVQTGFLATVDLATCQAIAAPVTFTLIPQNFAVSPDGTRLFMTGSNTLWMVIPVSLSGGVGG